jgi:hypothetical protein
VNFATITLCVSSQRMFIVVVAYFVIDSVRKLLNIPSYVLLDEVNIGLDIGEIIRLILI